MNRGKGNFTHNYYGSARPTRWASLRIFTEVGRRDSAEVSPGVRTAACGFALSEKKLPLTGLPAVSAGRCC